MQHELFDRFQQARVIFKLGKPLFSTCVRSENGNCTRIANITVLTWLVYQELIWHAGYCHKISPTLGSIFKHSCVLLDKRIISNLFMSVIMTVFWWHRRPVWWLCSSVQSNECWVSAEKVQTKASRNYCSPWNVEESKIYLTKHTYQVSKF